MAKKDTLVLPIIDAQGNLRTLKELQKYTKDLKDGLAGLERGTKEYDEQLEKLKANQSEINKINEDARIINMNTTQQLQNGIRVVNGIAGAFGAANAALSVFGVESEAVGQALVKLQAFSTLATSLMSVTTGIKAATVAWKSFNIILLASPLFWIGTIIAAVAAGVLILNSLIKEAKTDVTSLQDAFDDLTKGINKTNDAFEQQIEVLKALGAEEEEIIAARLANNQQLYEQLSLEVAKLSILRATANKEEAAEYRRQYEEILKLLDNNVKQREKITNDAEILDAKRRKESADKRKAASDKAAKELLDAQKKNNEASLKLEQDRLARAEKAIKEAAKDTALLDVINAQIEKNAKQREDLTKTIEDLGKKTNLTAKELTTLTNARNKLNSLEDDAVTLNKELVEQNKQVAADLKSINQLIEENTRARELNNQRRELFDASDKARAEFEIEQYLLEQQRIEERKEQLNILLQDEELSNEKRIELLTKLGNEQQSQFRIEQSIYQARKKLSDEENKRVEQRVVIASGAFSSLSDLIGEQTAAGKAAAIASATIDTYRAANSALANDAIGPARYVAAAAAIASGLANVKKIVSVNVPGSSSSMIAENTESYEAPVFPALQNPIQETHNNLNAADEDFFNTQQQQVYVVESDISGMQNKVKVSETQMGF